MKALISSANIFTSDTFWKSQDSRKWSSICGMLISIPCLALVIILLVLKVMQMTNFGMGVTNTQINYSYDPAFVTINTGNKNPAYAPFMLAFTINIDAESCPNSAITFQPFVNQYAGAYNSANRSTSKIPLKAETCTDNHFAMLPGKLAKLKQWTNSSLYCLPYNSNFQIGGANLISELYKNIQFQFNCPSTCNASTCGFVEFFSASSTINPSNSTQPFSYSLDRSTFAVQSAPKYQVSYQIDSSNLTTDTSFLPFGLYNYKTGVAVSSIIVDIPQPANDINTYVTLQRSDKTVIYNRGYYKVFDLFAYIGGLVYGLLIFFFFLKRFSKIQFEFNFAAECFRASDAHAISIGGYLQQFFYEMIALTPYKPDWKLASQRKQSREITNRVLDVIYLNKRITFLQEAIQLMFQKHQLKGIHLLHNLTKDEVKGKINSYRLRDRLVFFLGRKYSRYDRQQQQHKPLNSQHTHEAQPMKASSALNSSHSIQSDPHNFHEMEIKDVQRIQSKAHLGHTTEKELKSMKKIPSIHQPPKKPTKLTLKSLVTSKMIEEQQMPDHMSDSQIINEAEKYYSEIAQRQMHDIVNSRVDNRCLKRELKFIGDLSNEELNQIQLVEEVKTDLRKLIEEGEKPEGNQVSKKIYQKLDEWMKNYLRDTLKNHHE